MSHESAREPSTEPTDDFWRAQVFERVNKKQREDAAITERMIEEYEERHKNDVRRDEANLEGGYSSFEETTWRVWGG